MKKQLWPSHSTVLDFELTIFPVDTYAMVGTDKKKMFSFVQWAKKFNNFLSWIYRIVMKLQCQLYFVLIKKL